MAAHLDDAWLRVGDFSMVADQPLKGRVSATPTLLPDDDGGGDGGDVPEASPGEHGTFKSPEDLANDFEAKLSVCFRHVKGKTDTMAPVDEVAVIGEDTVLQADEIWNALTNNYGRVMPVEWKHSRTRSLHIPTFNLEEKPRKSDILAELTDDEDLREQLDMHSIIVSSIAEEPLYTAEQVIEEIEEMMQDSPEMEAKHNPSESDLSMLSVDVQRSSPSYHQRMKSLSVAELNERLEETEATIRRFSEELVMQLALRDELDFEKEVKNSFISALIDVQNRQKEQRELLRKKKKLKGGAGTSHCHTEKALGSRFSIEGLSSVIQNSFRQTFGSPCTERQYLTTVIPYEKKGLPPSLEDLQILTKILQAMRDDSDKVPGLLTDYILKVLCPT
ncbi:fasciculation and elongation protein zeta-2 [Aulostomus maculatus]